MKNKSVVAIIGILGLGITCFMYTLVTTGLLLYNLKNRGILPPHIHYKFALASLDSKAITLYHVTSEKWNEAFNYKVQLTPILNGVSGQIHNIHVNSPKIIHSLYGGTLVDKLANYRVTDQFFQEWPLSTALFNLASPQSILTFNIQKLQGQTYQINLQIQSRHTKQIDISALANIQNDSFNLKQAQATIQDPNLLKQLQEYAKSRNQPVPQAMLTMSTHKNEVKTKNQDNSKQLNSK